MNNNNECPFVLSKEDFLKLKEAICDELRKDFSQNIQDIVKESVLDLFGKLHDLPLSVPQVANLLGENPKAVYKMCDRKHIPFTKVGRKTFINIKDINKNLILVDSHNKS